MHKFLPLLVFGGMFSAVSAHAQLAHHYNLTDGTDSVTGANQSNGTLTNGATFANGMLTTAGTGYLSLPSSVGTGITGDFSIEAFTSTTVAGTSYSTLFSFSTSQTNFILFNANRPGVNATTADFEQTPATGNNVEINVSGGSALLADGAEHDILLSYTSATGAVSIYNNGALAGTGNIGAGFNFQTASAGAFDGINGGAPFTGDATYSGSTDDFRIYSQALTAAQAAALDKAGVNATNGQIASAIPEPSAWTAALAGVATLLGLQRFRRQAQA